MQKYPYNGLKMLNSEAILRLLSENWDFCGIMPDQEAGGSL
ncbi:hypothetical protein Holit_00986 [Hollandina sp. SP2]